MTALAQLAGQDCLLLAICMAITAAVIGSFAGIWALLQAAYGRLVARGCPDVDHALPGHREGRVRSSRAHHRRLHRDLTLLLVVNADRADEDV